MKNIALVSFIALAASQAAGCIITSDDTVEKAHIATTWSIKDIASGQQVTCPPTFDTAALFSQAANSDGSPVGVCRHSSDISGTCFIDLFNCSDGAGVSAPLPPSNYLTWVEIQTHDGSQTYATGVNPHAPAGDTTLIDVTNVDQSYDNEIFDDGGHFRMQWDLHGATSGAALTCDGIGAGAPNGGVELLSTVSGGSQSATDIFPCGDFEGTTTGLLAASYTVSVDALDQNMRALGTAPALTNKPIGRQSMITDLGMIDIPIDGM